MTMFRPSMRKNAPLHMTPNGAPSKKMGSCSKTRVERRLAARFKTPVHVLSLM